MSQEIINWAFGGIGVLLGFLLNATRDSIKSLQMSDKELAEKVSQIEVLVAGDYVHREAFEKTTDRMFEKLEAIETKLDRKVDKSCQ